MQADLTRIDTTLDFGWDNKSPDDEKIHRDFFFGRWQGFLQAPFGETYTLSIASDDGARMWIDDELIFEYWQPQATTEHFFNYAFEAGKKYPIKIEYFERDGGAAIHLRWQSAHTPRAIIPKRQLYPLATGSLEGIVWLDIEGDGRYDGNEKGMIGASVILLDETYSFIDHSETDSAGRFVFQQSIGTYYLHIVTPSGYRDWQPSTGLDMTAYSEAILISPDSSVSRQFGYIPNQLTNINTIESSAVSLKPNPIQNQFTLNSLRRIESVEIYNSTGTLVKKQHLTASSNVINISVPHLTPGPYLVKIKTDEGPLFKKIIKI